MKRKPEYPTPRKIMGEAVQRLKGPCREVYLMTVRDGKSIEDTAEVLSMSENLAKAYQDQAIKFVEGYCKQAITKGRL